MSDYTLEEAIADARGWIEGATFHEGQRGLKPALAVILDEFDCVTRDHADCDEFAAALMKERDDLRARLAEAERWINECLGWVPQRGIGGQLRDSIREWRATDSARPVKEG